MQIKPGTNGNLCIAGHNYNDNRFFSKINELNIGDEIIIEDQKNNSYNFNIYNKYEIDEQNAYESAINKTYKHELTLVTCNNQNHKRIIIKAKKESL